MDDLSREFDGRAQVARFMIMTKTWDYTSERIRDKYELNAVPIVILFNRGVEVRRWVLMVPEGSCRDELNKLIPPPRRPAARPFSTVTVGAG
jgi:hypothetical protein